MQTFIFIYLLIYQLHEKIFIKKHTHTQIHIINKKKSILFVQFEHNNI